MEDELNCLTQPFGATCLRRLGLHPRNRYLEYLVRALLLPSLLFLRLFRLLLRHLGSA